MKIRIFICSTLLSTLQFRQLKISFLSQLVVLKLRSCKYFYCIVIRVQLDLKGGLEYVLHHQPVILLLVYSPKKRPRDT